MEHDELALRRRARQQKKAIPEEHPEPTIEELGRRAAEAYLTSQRAVALDESEVKLEMLWRDVERWTDAYIAAIRRAQAQQS
jgi:hypothetical protein